MADLKTVKATAGKILATMIDSYGDLKRSAGGIILKDDDATETSIRARWFQIYSVGDDIDWIKEGDYVMVDHGRWSNGLKINDDLKLHLLDNKDCLAMTDSDPTNRIVIQAREIRKRPADDQTRYKL